MSALLDRLVSSLTMALVAWTQFRMGPQNNAVVPGELHAAWRVETSGQISASPTVADGTLYVGNNNGLLYALDVSNGAVLWQTKVPNPLMSAPLVYNDLVIVGEGDPTSRTSSPTSTSRRMAPKSRSRVILPKSWAAGRSFMARFRCVFRNVTSG